MVARKTLGAAALLIFALAGCVLVDSWFVEDGFIDPDGEGPKAPIATFEIAAKNTHIKLEIDTTPLIPACLETSAERAEPPPTVEIACEPPCPRPVDPAGWLGRRHFRSPT